MQTLTLEKAWREAVAQCLREEHYNHYDKEEVIGMVQSLLAEAIQKPRSYLYSNPLHELTVIEKERYQSFINRLQAKEPRAYISGKTEFFSLELIVTQDVLIPRHETELLVERAIDSLSGFREPTVLELGTGSGAIAIAIAKHLPAATIIATDISAKALTVASQNAKRHNVNNIRFIESDWFAKVPPLLFNCIVSNPPYLTSDEWQKTPNLHQEPVSAFIGGEDGLESYRQILLYASKFLLENGQVLFEHGYSQRSQVTALLETFGFENITSFKDLSGHERVISAFVNLLHTKHC